MVTWPAASFHESVMTLGQAGGAVSGSAYTLHTVVRLTGPLEIAALDGAYDDLIARNDVLRSTVVRDGAGWVQRVHQHHGAALTHVDPDGRRPDELAAAWAAEPVPIDRPPLVRGLLAELGPDDHVLGLVFHHLHVDPRSLGLAVRELAAAYEARLAGERIPPPAMQFGAYTLAARAADAARPAEERAAWLRSLADVQPMRYVRERARPADARPEAGTLQRPVLDADGARRLEHWALGRRTTFFGALLTGFCLDFADHVVDGRIFVSTVFERRDRPETRAMIGPFLHPGVIRVRVPSGSTWETLAPQVRDAVFTAYSNATVPMAEVFATYPNLLAARPARPGVTCLFQYLPADGGSRLISFGAATGAISSTSQPSDASPGIGLMFRLRRTRTGDMVARVTYDRHAWNEAEVSVLFDEFAGQLAGRTAGASRTRPPR